jgi:hypothetical protein
VNLLLGKEWGVECWQEKEKGGTEEVFKHALLGLHSCAQRTIAAR